MFIPKPSSQCGAIDGQVPRMQRQGAGAARVLSTSSHGHPQEQTLHRHHRHANKPFDVKAAGKVGFDAGAGRLKLAGNTLGFQVPAVLVASSCAIRQHSGCRRSAIGRQGHTSTVRPSQCLVSSFCHWKFVHEYTHMHCRFIRPTPMVPLERVSEHRRYFLFPGLLDIG